MKRAKGPLQGFTLIELMITVVVVAILAGIATPIYLNYSIRAYYTEVVKAADPFRLGVLECYQITATLTGCNGGTHHIPSNITTATGSVASVTAVNGVITVTPVVQNGILATDTYILTPTISGTTVVWTSSGGGVTSGYTT